MRSRLTPMTALLLAAIGVVFLLELAKGGSTDQQVLLAMGANYAPLVQAGEHWRLIASMFLHIGWIHLLLNAWALYQLGTLFETWMGPWRLFAVYFMSGVAGSLASVIFTQGLSAGASGAIFGLMGALIGFLLRRRSALLPQGKSLLGQLVMWAAINVYLGLTMPGIDNAAHLGGCAAGFVIGLLLKERPPRATTQLPGPEGGSLGVGGHPFNLERRCRIWQLDV